MISLFRRRMMNTSLRKYYLNTYYIVLNIISYKGIKFFVQKDQKYLKLFNKELHFLILFEIKIKFLKNS